MTKDEMIAAAKAGKIGRKIAEPYRATVLKIAALRDTGGTIELTADDVANVMAMGIALSSAQNANMDTEIT